MAQAFDPAGIIKTVGAPSFALFAKGGSQESLRSHAGGLRGRTGLRDGRSRIPQVYLIGTHRRQVPAPFAVFQRFCFAPLSLAPDSRIRNSPNLWNHRVSTDCVGPVLGSLGQALQEFL